MRLQSYAQGKWFSGLDNPKDLFDAVTGEKIAEITSNGLDFQAMLEYARGTGNPKLRNMTFHERGRMLKSMAQYLMDRKDELYDLSFSTGATRIDSWIDIEGGIGTFFTYASKGRREVADETFYVDGDMEVVSKNGTFVGHHICVPMTGTAVHINAFNFPCWGMLEKLACNFLAGVPAIVKPASLTAYLTERLVKMMIESNILPPGALQLVCGSAGDLLDHVTERDIITFTGSADTGQKLKSHPNIVKNCVRFNMEADSLNCCILGADVTPEQPEFKLFVKEVVREMTVKAGQKCTAIRRVIVPQQQVDAVLSSLKDSLAKIKIGDPRQEGVRMGPLAGEAQVKEVRERVEELKQGGEVIYGDGDFKVQADDQSKGAFFPTTLLYCSDPFTHRVAHNVEAFGPVSTVVPYKNTDQAIELAALGKGSLVGSLFTANPEIAKEVVLGVAPYHGRVAIIDRECAKESTGHGSPLPHLVHGGPGRAGGGEEMGGVRGVLHYMQRTAIQGSPTMLGAICNQWLRGGKRTSDRIHPFQKYFDELAVGESFTTHRRTITEADVVNFAGISGDYFYAHTDDIAAKESFFEKRVAHGYFVLSAAAGLFVHPAPGPVIANYGLENLRFTEPVYPGDTIYVKLTCEQKTKKEKKEDQKLQGVVHWDVEVFNQEDVLVAVYTILTLVERKED